MVISDIDFALIEKRYNEHLFDLHRRFLLRKEFAQGNKFIPSYSEYIGDTLFDLGTYCYILGRQQDAKEFFISACKYFQQWYKYNNSKMKNKWLYSTIYSENERQKMELGKIIVSKIPPPTNTKDPHPGFYELLIIGQILSNDVSDNSSQITLLEENFKKALKSRNFLKEGLYYGTVQMIKGLLEKNKPLFVEGCIDGLKNFSRYVKMYTTPLCSDVLMYLYLAREKEIVIEIEDIPKKFRLYIFRYFEEKKKSMISENKQDHINTVYNSKILNQWFMNIKHWVIHWTENYKSSTMSPIGHIRQTYPLAFIHYHAGEHALVLAKPDESREHFTKACGYFSEVNKSIPWGGSEVATDIGVLDHFWIASAIVTKNPELINSCCRELLQCVPKPKSTTNVSYNESLSLCHLLQRDFSNAEKSIESLEHIERELENSDLWIDEMTYMGRAKMIHALLEQDKSKFLEGFLNCLRHFSKSTTQYELPLCSDGLKYLYLAESFQIIINKDDIPNSFWNYICI